MIREGFIICNTCQRILTLVWINTENKDKTWFVPNDYSDRSRKRNMNFGHCLDVHGKPMKSKEYDFYELDNQKRVKAVYHKNSHLD